MDTPVKGQEVGDVGTGDPSATTATDGLAAERQPFLHDAHVILCAPSFVVSRPDGRMSHGVDGFFHGDRRALSRWEVDVEAVTAAPVHSALEAADRALFRSVLRDVGQHTADPAVTVDQLRQVTPACLEETVTVAHHGSGTVQLRLRVRVASDLAAMDRVKSGRANGEVTARAEADGLRWAAEGTTVTLRCSVEPATVDPATGALDFPVELAPGARWRLELRCTVETDEELPFAPAPRSATPWRRPRLRSADSRLDRCYAQSLADLERLLLADPRTDSPAPPAGPPDLFLAAGAPWYLTLFGRDALWAARMLLPWGTDLAASTLRTLARRQGRVVDRHTEEEPGKILHEIRAAASQPEAGLSLPPRYYGTIDATPLWVILLHDAWRWGLDSEQVRALLPHAEAALSWLAEYGDADGDGLLEYLDHTGHGLANQGWKDSGDSIRFRDGRCAAPPITLCEVQAYAFEAARGGAALLRAFGRPGADHWEEWAARLQTRFRESFWVADAEGPFPAVALDRDKRPVDSVTSGFGHLLGTGLLDPKESALVAERLARLELDSGYGLRTLSSAMGGFNPLGYHIGSVWPHDTAIAVHGLVRAGFPDVAASLAQGLVEAAAAFEGRLPELFSGDSRADSRRPTPYPASCRPQAWAAAAPVLVVQSLLGLTADVPSGTLTVAPAPGHAFQPLRVSGLQVAGHPLEVEVDAAGGVDVRTEAALRVVRG